MVDDGIVGIWCTVDEVVYDAGTMSRRKNTDGEAQNSMLCVVDPVHLSLAAVAATAAAASASSTRGASRFDGIVF